VSNASAHLTLLDERCDRCGACRHVCPHDALKVGSSFIYVDWRKCDGCLACVEACDRGAIVSRTVPLRSSSVQSTVPLSEVSKVVVGSRAEAKAVRKAAELAAKSAKKAPKPPKEPKAGKTPKRESVEGADTTPRREHAPMTARGFESDDVAQAAGPAFASRRVELAVTADAPEEPRAPRSLAVSFSLPNAFSVTLAHTSGSPTEWTLVDAAAVLAIALAALLGKNVVLAAKAVTLMPALGKTVVRVVALVIFYVVQFAAIGWLASRHGTSALKAFGLGRRQADDESRPSLLGTAGLVLGLLVGVEAIGIGYGLLMRAVGTMPPQMLSSDLSTVFGTGPIGLVFAALLVAVAAPIAEELVFRGIVLPALGDRWGAWVGIGASAVLFAAYHLQPWLAFPMLVFGAALGWLTWTRRSLWPAIWLHVLFNAVSVLAAFAGPR
jgi:membrane protease YdiL (CAAX protease family)/Fe-S-cluster-containing hydrogenase component 2